jgi:hypothetical protein
MTTRRDFLIGTGSAAVAAAMPLTAVSEAVGGHSTRCAWCGYGTVFRDRITAYWVHDVGWVCDDCLPEDFILRQISLGIWK